MIAERKTGTTDERSVRELVNSYRNHPYLFLGLLCVAYAGLGFLEDIVQGFPMAASVTGGITHLVTTNAAWLLDLFYDTRVVEESANVYRIFMDGRRSVAVSYPCNGLSLFFLFIVFISVSGGNRKQMLWFLPAGIVSIHLVNVIRIFCLALIYEWNPYWIDFNHKYVFTVIVYSWIFILYMIWMKKFQDTGQR